jgi:protein TonB
MRTKLLESSRERKRSFGGTTISTLAHASVIGAAILGTSTAAVEAGSVDSTAVQIVYHEPPKPQRRDAAVPSARQQMPTPVETRPTLQVVDLTTIPDLVPTTSSTIETLAIEAFARTLVDPRAQMLQAESEVFTEFTVERAVTPRSGNPTPNYPRMLAQAGIEGIGHVQFVVDSAGRVERESIRVLRSDHAQFENAVRDAVERMRFLAAEAGGRRVRQLVEQPFSFAIRR